jgi:putative oxidoreductase
MLYHGLQKVRAPAQAAPFFESIGIRPGRTWAFLTGLAETFAGAAAVVGIATRPAALLVIATQAVAIWKVHAPKGYENMKGGMEYNLALVSIASGLLIEGPRRISAHHAVQAARAGSRRSWFGRPQRSGLDRALAIIH